MVVRLSLLGKHWLLELLLKRSRLATDLEEDGVIEIINQLINSLINTLINYFIHLLLN